MRVTLISGEYPPMRGGVADYTALLAAGLARFGLEVTVLTSARVTGRFTDLPPRVYPWVESWGVGLWTRIADHVAKTRPDVVHVQYQTGAFDLSAAINLWPWLMRLRFHRPKVVVTFHDLKVPYILPKLGPLRHLATHLLAAGADAVVVTNPEDYARLAGNQADRSGWRWGRRRLAGIPIGSNIPSQPPSGFDRAVWRERLGVRDGDVVLTYFGFLSPAKGLDTLSDAFEMLVRRGLPVRLLMVGAAAGDSGNPNRRYENLVRQRLDQPLLRGRVGWTGFADAPDVAAHLQSADVCVLPFRDGVSLRHGTLIAAIVQHLPIITTLRPDVDQRATFPALRDGEHALLVPPGDAPALATAIERLVSDAALRLQLSDGAARLAGEFCWDTIASRTLRLYQEICRSA